MQRLFATVLLLIAALYGSAQAFSTHAEDNLQGSVPVASSVPHIALLLPLDSLVYGQAAEVVKQGFITAMMREKPLALKIRVYATTGDPLDTLIDYQQALSAGAIMVVGPLTRDGVNALASSHFVTVPTLALNAATNNRNLPVNLYLFGLQLENEASQVADLATRENRSHVIIIASRNLFSVRLQTAFANRWLQYRSGMSAESIQFDDDQVMLRELRRYTAGTNSIVFLALDAKKSRLIRSFLSPGTPVYATSQVFIGNDDTLFNHDLNDIQFLDMPWLLQPDHPAVMAYKHMDGPVSTDMARFYALGIDAFRIMVLMFQAQTASDISLDGVTGHISFMPANYFIRKPIVAMFSQGRALLMDAPK